MHTSAERRAWFDHYHSTGCNIAATCRFFRITRATFYKWYRRYDPKKPQRPLRSQSRRPRHHRKASWTQKDLVAVSDVLVQHPTWGRRRLHALLRSPDREFPLSERTLGRMLQRIKQRCPKCKKPHGQHEWWHHPAVPAEFQDRARPSPQPSSQAPGEMQAVIVQGLDLLIRAWATASPEARRIFDQQR